MSVIYFFWIRFPIIYIIMFSMIQWMLCKHKWRHWATPYHAGSNASESFRCESFCTDGKVILHFVLLSSTTFASLLLLLLLFTLNDVTEFFSYTWRQFIGKESSRVLDAKNTFFSSALKFLTYRGLFLLCLVSLSCPFPPYVSVCVHVWWFKSLYIFISSIFWLLLN